MSPALTNNVLVTGATGFVASHTIDQLLVAGYTIVATTRDVKKAQGLYSVFPHYLGKVTFVAVPDFSTTGAFDTVFQENQFDYVLHLASPIPFDSKDIQKDFIDPGLRGIETLFTAAKAYGGSTLKRIVLTSSGVTLIDPFAGESDTSKVYDETMWNPVTAEIAVSSGNSGLGYFASKTLAEHAAWDFIAKENPNFDLSVLLPVIVLGPALTPVKSPKDVEQGADAHIYTFINGKDKTTDRPFIFYSHVDVRDVARAHILAMSLPAAGGQRISLASPDVLTPQSVVNAINKNFPDIKQRVAKGDPTKLFPTGVSPPVFSGAKASKIFGDGWFFRSLETSVVDVVSQLLEQEKSFVV